MTMPGGVKVGQKVILKRKRQNVIQQNLYHMAEAGSAKKLAQELYYSANEGKSPLLQPEFVKPPVHLRLGEEKKFNPPPKFAEAKTFTAAPTLGNQKRFNAAPNFGRQRRFNIDPKYANNQPAQNKFRWRGQYPNGLLTKKYRNMLHNQPHAIPRMFAQRRLEALKRGMKPSGVQKVILTRKRKIQAVRPLQAHNGMNPTNIKVLLRNHTNGAMPYKRHSVRLSTNMGIQNEIQLIQSQLVVSEPVPNLPIFGGGQTNIMINERFSNYP